MKKTICMALGTLLLLLTACGTNGQGADSSVNSTSGNGTTSASQPTTAVEVLNINSKEQFGSEERYAVSYRLEGDDTTQHGYMDAAGIITTEAPQVPYENSGASFVIYDDSGNEIYSSPSGEYWQIEGRADNNVYLVQQLRSGLDESATYVGLMDETGNWLYGGPVNVTELTGIQLLQAGRSENLGENMMSVYCAEAHGNYLVLFNGETGNYTLINDVWNHDLKFYGDTMVFQHWDGGTSGGDLGEICSVDKNGNVTVLPTQGDLLCTGSNGFLTDTNELSFYNNQGQLIWSFDQYPLSDTYTPILYDDVVFAHVTGADGNSYIACISQSDGSLVYEPIRDSYNYIYQHYILTEISDANCFVDLLTGETLATPQDDFDLDEVEYYSQGLYAVKHRESGEYSYLFYDYAGNQVTPGVVEE